MKTLYTVRRCKNDETLYGPSHGSDDGEKTICGEDLDLKWYITDNAFGGNISCKKCLKIIETFPNPIERIL